MSAYSCFAEFYDTLTLNVGYEQRADYLMRLFHRHHHQPGLTLDLACGTGSLMLELSRRGVDVFGADASSEMLAIAQQKFAEEDRQVLLLCQKMQRLQLYGTIHTCLCTLDSLNHLPSRDDVLKTFHRIAAYLEDDGLLVFDCNTVYKHQTVLADNCFIYDMEKVFCAWQNHYLKRDHQVVITLDFFEPEGNHYRRYSEQFTERAYSREQMTEMLGQAGLKIEAVYDDMSFSAPKENSQREIYVVRKRKNE